MEFTTCNVALWKKDLLSLWMHFCTCARRPPSPSCISIPEFLMLWNNLNLDLNANRFYAFKLIVLEVGNILKNQVWTIQNQDKVLIYWFWMMKIRWNFKILIDSKQYRVLAKEWTPLTNLPLFIHFPWDFLKCLAIRR